jgi:hypothetical protein
MLIEKGIPTICGFGPKGGAPHAPNGTSCAVTTRLFPLPLLTLHFNPRTEWVDVASLGKFHHNKAPSHTDKMLSGQMATKSSAKMGIKIICHWHKKSSAICKNGHIKIVHWSAHSSSISSPVPFACHHHFVVHHEQDKQKKVTGKRS